MKKKILLIFTLILILSISITGIVDLNKKYNINTIKKCEITYYNVSEIIYADCYNEINKTFNKCYNGTIQIQKNYTTCKKIGYNISYDEKSFYEIEGECCGYFEDTNQVICKETIAGICNPKCQQTSTDKTNYDEYCTIYDLNKDKVDINVVGEYSYVKTKKIRLSLIEVKLIK